MNNLTQRIGHAIIETALQTGTSLQDSNAVVVIRNRSGETVFANTGFDRPFDTMRENAIRNTGKPAVCFEKISIDDNDTACLTIYFPVKKDDEITGIGMIGIPVESHKPKENGQKGFSMTERLPDTRTGIRSTPFMLANLQKEMLKGDGDDSHTTVILMNIDNFAKMNEEWGQFSGTLVLAEFCQLILKHLRSSDLFGKWNEREFILLLPDTSLTTGKHIAKRIEMAIEQKQFSQVGQITASLGVVTHRKDETLEDFINRMDAAVFAAKTSGKKRVELKANHFLKLVWKHEYECGNQTIDEEHRQLFFHSSQLLHAIYDNKAKKQISPLIHQLLTHIQMHFDNEEKIMASIGYPQTDEHAVIHRQLVHKAVHFSDLFEGNKLDFAEIFSFLANDVIIEHMHKEDRKFFSFLP